MAVDVQTTLAHLRRLEEAQRAAAQERAARVKAQLGAASARLRARGAGRVWLFGSMAGSDVGPDADVDLAVEGLPSADYFAVLADLMELFGAGVDLVRVEEAAPSLVARIEAEGVAL